MNERIIRILNVCLDSLRTYGKHPIIESQVNRLISDIQNQDSSRVDAEVIVKLAEEIDKMINETRPPCKHKGCYNHITHACEGCGRIQGKITQEAVMVLMELKSKFSE